MPDLGGLATVPQTFANKTIDSATNSLKNIRENAIYTIFIDGTTVKARNNVTGAIDFTADNTVNAVTAINSAINNIKNISGATLDTRWGARIYLAAGVYKCTTNLLDSGISTDSNREGIQLQGSGMGTVLNFVPASALTDAITFTSSNSGLRDVMVKVNSNVTNAVHINGFDATDEVKGGRGIIQACRIEGANAGGTYIPVTNQVGILLDGSTANKTYWWKFVDLDIVVFDIGLYLFGGANCTSSYTDHIDTLYCNTGVDCTGSQHFISNVFAQGGASNGTYGVRLRGTSNTNLLVNILGEQNLATTCATVVLDSGAQNNSIVGVNNSFADNTTKFTVLNNSGNLLNSIQYYDAVNGLHTFDSNINLNGRAYLSKLGGYYLTDVSGGGGAVLRLHPSNTTDYMLMQFFPGDSITSGGSSGTARSLFRFYNNSDAANQEFLEFGAYGTGGFNIGSAQTGTGSLRPVVLHQAYTPVVTVNTDTSLSLTGAGINFGGQVLSAKTGGYVMEDLSGSGLSIQQLHPATSTDTMFQQFVPGSGFTTVANTTLRSLWRFYNKAITGDNEYLDIRAEGTNGYKIGATRDNAGSLRPLTLHMNFDDVITINTDDSINFNNRPVTNLALQQERTGKATASGNGSTTVFNIAHGLGSTPSYVFVDCASHAIARTFTADATNITVTFASAPGSGTNNVIIYWRVIA